jgi:hypothetical protein
MASSHSSFYEVPGANQRQPRTKQWEVDALKKQIAAEIESCEDAWVYVLFRCRDQEAKAHRDAAVAYFNKYDKSGQSMLTVAETDGKFSNLYNHVDDRWRALRKQLKHAAGIVAVETTGGGAQTSAASVRGNHVNS